MSNITPEAKSNQTSTIQKTGDQLDKNVNAENNQQQRKSFQQQEQLRKIEEQKSKDMAEDITS